MEEKNNKKLYVIIVLLCLVIVGLCVYIFLGMSKNNTNENNNITPETQKTVETLPKDTVISKAQDFLDGDSWLHYFDEEETSNLCLEGSIYSLFMGYKGSINDIPNQTKLQMVYWSLAHGLNGKEFEELTSDEILAYFKKLFGSDYNITFEDIKVIGEDNLVAWKYNASTKKYEDAETGRGISSWIRVLKSNLVNYSEPQEGKYVLTFKQLFMYDEETEDGIKYVFTNLENKELFTKGGDLFEGSKELSKQHLEDVIKNDLPKYEKDLIEVEYTFEVENNELVLKSINY